MDTSSKKSLYVILADDDADDRMIFEDALSETGLNVSLKTVQDGEELMNYLLYSATILPEILFLDLNMPFKNGFQCLEEIRRHKALQDLFIIIYSTTGSQREIDEVYKLGANLFVIKPNSYTELKSLQTKLFSTDIHQNFDGLSRDKFVIGIS